MGLSGALAAVLLMSCALANAAHGAKPLYTAAALQLSILGSFTNSPQTNLRLNLENIATHVARAKEQGAQLVVLPELLLSSFGLSTRTTMRAYADQVVEPNPCPDLEGGQAACEAGSQLHCLACIARNQSVVLVANLVLRVPCAGHSLRTSHHIPSKESAERASAPSASASACPSDGEYLYNSDVAFAEDGSILQVYHKMHPFGTAPIIDPAHNETPKSFVTSFGVEFGMLICFDMEFPTPARGLLSRGVRAFVASMMWATDAPLFSAPMFQQAWSRFYNATLIIANRADSGRVAGGGIFRAGSSLAEWYDPDALGASRIVLATLPIEERVNANMTEFSVFPDGELSGPAQPPAMIAGLPANCTTEQAAEPFPCSLLDVDRHSAFSSSVTTGTLTCTVRVTIAAMRHASTRHSISQAPPSGWWALIAKQQTMVFPHTPDPLPLEACAFIFCNATVTHTDSGAVASCQHSFAAPLVFNSLLLTANMHAPTVLPMLSGPQSTLLPRAAMAANNSVLILLRPAAIASAVLYGLP